MTDLNADGPHSPDGAACIFARSAYARAVPLHGKKAAGRTALVDDADYDLVMQYRWYLTERTGKSGLRWGPYAIGRIGDSKAPMRYMHKLITGWPETDHVNHDGLDNRRENLREVARGQNNANQRPVRGGSSRYKGVVLNRHGTWTACVKVHGRPDYLGNFSEELDAALAYDTAAKRYFGEFACLNFPEEPA